MINLDLFYSSPVFFSYITLQLAKRDNLMIVHIVTNAAAVYNKRSGAEILITILDFKKRKQKKKLNSWIS